MKSIAAFLHERIERLLTWWFHYLQRRALAVVLLTVAAAAGTLHYAVNHIGIDTSTTDMLSEQLPWRQDQIRYRQAFPQYSDTILIVIDGQTPDEARDAAIRIASRIAPRTDIFQYQFAPQIEPFLQRNGLLYLDQAELEELADNLARVQPFLARLATDPSVHGLFSLLTQALTESADVGEVDLDFAFERIARVLAAGREGRHQRLSWEELMNGKDATTDDRRQTIVTVPRLDRGSLAAGEDALDYLRATVRELGLDERAGVRVRLTGGAALAHDELRSASLSAQFASIGSLLMVAAVMAFGLRSLWLVAVVLTALVLGLVFTAGFAALAIGRLNLISVAFAVMYIGLGADYAIYLCLRYRELAADLGDHREALARAARHVGGSLGLCTIATSIGFFAFVPTSYSGVAELGLISGCGMFISLFVTLAILPALIALRPRVRPPREARHRLSGMTSGLLSLPLRRARPVVIGAALVAVGAVAVLPRAHFDHNPLNLQDPAAESVQTYLDLLATNGRSPWAIVALAAGADEARALKGKLQGLATVDKVVTLENLIPEDQPAKLALIEDLALTLGPDITAPADAASTGDGSADVQTLRALQSELGADPVGPVVAAMRAELGKLLDRLDNADTAARAGILADLNDRLISTLPGRLQTLAASLEPGPVGLDNLPPVLRERWLADSGAWRIEIQPGANMNDARAMRQFVTEVRGLLPTATGSPVVYLEASDAVVNAFRQAFAYALVAIVALLLIALDHKRDVILVLTPLLLAALLTAAAMVLAGVPFNFANIIALPLLLGMGVDNGIHMVHRFRTAPPDDGLLLGTSTAMAVGLSALTNVSGFGNLAASAHRGMASMGVMLTIGILITLACTMIVLPSLLALLYRPGQSPNSDLK